MFLDKEEFEAMRVLDISGLQLPSQPNIQAAAT